MSDQSAAAQAHAPAAQAHAPAGQARRPRADAERNRLRLLEAASAAFASGQAAVTLDQIARDAGVGIGTLYRHFPTRESLVDAVYRDQVIRLTTGARDLLEQLPPAQAMRRWMDLFGDWVATKHGMLETLLAMIESGEIAEAQTRTESARVPSRRAISLFAVPPAVSSTIRARKTIRCGAVARRDRDPSLARSASPSLMT